MTYPLVSVIIPLYNAEAYIKESIASIVEQTYQKLEIIIVDDGSSDNSVEVAKSVEDDRIKIYQQQNKGVSTARNYGIELAKGTYIQFLDADDLIEATKIEAQIKEVLKQTSLPTFVCSNWARIEHHSTARHVVVQSYHIPKLDQLPINFIAGDNFIPLMSGLVLKDTIVKVGGFNTKMTHIEDINLLIKIYKENANFLFLHSDRPLFYYRNVPNSASKLNTFAFYQGIYANCQLLKQLFGFKRKPLLLENYWNIYLNSITNSYSQLNQLAIVELKQYKLEDYKNLKFGLFKIVGSRAFNILYHLYAKYALKLSDKPSTPKSID